MKSPQVQNFVDDAEVIQHFEASWLQALASRPNEVILCFVDNPEFDSAAREIAGQGQTGRPGSHDQDWNGVDGHAI
jgi:hypothetical protein